jgi:hypothetical protein
MLFYLELSMFHTSSDIKKYQVLIIPMNHGQCVGGLNFELFPQKNQQFCTYYYFDV